ncbi:MAG: putative transposase [Opitutaceae bacterium]
MGEAVIGADVDRNLLPAPWRASPPVSNLSERSLADSEAPMGYATTRPLERVLAACGMLTSAELEFVPADDVPQGGVLCALAALLTEGLLRHTRRLYALPPGFYPIESIFLVLALLALVRCPSLERTRYESPGGNGASCWAWTGCRR